MSRSPLPCVKRSWVRGGEVCRKMGISQATFFHWKQKFGGLGPSEHRKLRQLEEENLKLKRFVADLSLDKAMRWDNRHEAFRK